MQKKLLRIFKVTNYILGLATPPVWQATGSLVSEILFSNYFVFVCELGFLLENESNAGLEERYTHSGKSFFFIYSD